MGIRFGFGVVFGAVLSTAAATAAAQVDEPAEGDPAQEAPAQPAPAAPTEPAPDSEQATQAPPPAGAASPAPAAEQPKTMLVVVPDHRFELTGRLGMIGGGEVTPHGLDTGHSQPSWVAAVDLDAITLPFNPFFTIGVYALATSTGYERFSGGKMINTDGSMTLVSFGPSAKARLPLTRNLTLKTGVYVGYNYLSFSSTESGKQIGASGGGLNIGFSGELDYELSRAVALAAQASFVSQVTGSVTVDSDNKDHDLEMTPKPFITIGPQVNF